MDPRLDSQFALVNPEPPLELVLEKLSNPLNTRLLVDGRPRYKVSTVDREKNVTNIVDLRTNEIVATIRRQSFLADRVGFPRRFGGKSVKKDDWMTKVKLKNGQ